MLKPEARIITTICSLKLASKTLRFDFDTFITHVFSIYLCVGSHWIRIAIAPMQVQEYLDIRGQTAKSAFEPRESSAFPQLQQSPGRGYTVLQVPCQGVKRFKETGRSRYITDTEFDKVKTHAHFTAIDTMDLALLNGQRPADVLKFKRADMRDGALWIVQNKTGARLGAEITGELALVIARINKRPRRTISAFLIQDKNGQPLSRGTLRSRFDKARTAAKVDFQFRDIRGKAATDTGNLAQSQKLLGHKNRDMPENYAKVRAGERVEPLRKKSVSGWLESLTTNRFRTVNVNFEQRPLIALDRSTPLFHQTISFPMNGSSQRRVNDPSSRSHCRNRRNCGRCGVSARKRTWNA